MNSNSVLGFFLVAGALVVMAVVGMMQSSKYLKQYAVAQCMQVGVEEYIYPADNTRSTTPNQAAYKDCMAEMGYANTGK